MGWWSRTFKSIAEDWLFAPLGKEQVPGPPYLDDIESKQVYVEITLRSLRVVNVRKGLSKFYGAVHSFISLPHLTGQEACFQVVTTPGNLKDVDAERIDRVIQIDLPLLGPIPYRGGRIEMEIGLFSVKSADLAAPYLALLEKMSRVAGVSYINAALPFAEPLTEGISLLTGSESTSILEVGLSRTWNPLKTGWFLVMRAPKNQINVEQLHIDQNDYKVLDANHNPVRDFPYMVFSVSASEKRRDWFMIPEVIEPYQQLQSDVRSGNFDKAKESLTFFMRLVRTCPDLIRNDAEWIAMFVKNDIGKILDQTLTAKAKDLRLRNLEEIPLYSDF
jgi:hypothetical protein